MQESELKQKRTEALAALEALKANLSGHGHVTLGDVERYHRALDKLRDCGCDVEEYRIPEGEIIRPVWTDATGWQHPRDPYVQESVVMINLDTVLAAFATAATETAARDPVTNLRDRAAFDVELSERIREAERSDELLSLIMVDVDRFKRVNEAAIGYGQGTANATRQQVLDAARQIYSSYPEILRALGL